MENVNVNNKKVVQYEILTTKKYRNLVNVEYDEKYSEYFDEKVVHSEKLDLGIGDEITEECSQSVSSKIVNEPPDKFLTFRQKTIYENEDGVEIPTKQLSLSWGKILPERTLSVFHFNPSPYNYSDDTERIIYLDCSMEMVKELWDKGDMRTLGSHIIETEYKTKEKEREGLNRSYKRRKGSGVFINVYEVETYRRNREELFGDTGQISLVGLWK